MSDTETNKTKRVMPSENSGMYNLSMLITVLFGVLSVIVLSLILGKEEGHDSKSTSIIAMTVAVFAATISLVGFGVSIHKAFTQDNLKTNIVIAILSAFMAVLLCSFATDMNLKWHADPDMQYVSIIIVVFLSLFTAALLAAFVVVCYQAYRTPQSQQELLQEQKSTQEGQRQEGQTKEDQQQEGQKREEDQRQESPLELLSPLDLVRYGEIRRDVEDLIKNDAAARGEAAQKPVYIHQRRKIT